VDRFALNKAFAEIIAGLIPQKMARNRWRGILRYGIFRAIKLLWMLRQNKTTPKYNLTVCAIAKNEGAYFEEWIQWHKKMGVEKFYIYDNESDDNTKEVLAAHIESGLVEYKYFPGKKRQLPAYDHCLDNHRFDAHWIAIIDLDEFIVPQKDKTITEFLKRFEKFSAVEINWLVYGSGGAKEKTEGTVMERFKAHSQYDNILNRHVKTIVNPRRVFNMIGAHEAARLTGYTADPNMQKVTKNFRDREPQHDIIRINHYAVKSRAEFIEKKAKGRVRAANQIDFEYFELFDLNDITE
jgi:hypothetical protein